MSQPFLLTPAISTLRPAHGLLYSARHLCHISQQPQIPRPCPSSLYTTSQPSTTRKSQNVLHQHNPTTLSACHTQSPLKTLARMPWPAHFLRRLGPRIRCRTSTQQSTSILGTAPSLTGHCQILQDTYTPISRSPLTTSFRPHRVARKARRRTVNRTCSPWNTQQARLGRTLKKMLIQDWASFLWPTIKASSSTCLYRSQ